MGRAREYFLIDVLFRLYLETCTVHVEHEELHARVHARCGHDGFIHSVVCSQRAWKCLFMDLKGFARRE